MHIPQNIVDAVQGKTNGASAKPTPPPPSKPGTTSSAEKRPAGESAVSQLTKEAREAKELAALYEQENADLRAKLKAKTDKKAGAANSKKPVRDALYLLADEGLLTAAEVVQKLRALDAKEA